MASSIRKLFILQLFILFLLIVFHFFPERLSNTTHNWFDLDSETNIPTWYSTVLLFSVSFSSFGLFSLRLEDAHSRKFWLVFSCVYCFLSLDEAACVHEGIQIATSTKWVFIYAPFALAFFLMCAYHLIRSNNRTLRNWILGGLVVYALGGMGAECIVYLYRSIMEQQPLLYHFEVAVEEGSEMLGTIMVFRGCLDELGRRLGPVTITKAAP